MARGSARRTYTRDGRGRFASTGTTTAKARPAARRAATRAGNRLNRDNAGRISGIGRNGATVRGGRLRTASGNQRATQTASMKAAGFRPGVIAKGGRGVSGAVARSLAGVRRAQSQPKGLQPKLKAREIKAEPQVSSARRTRLGRSAGPLSSDGARKRGETTRNRSDVSGAIADVKSLGLPIYKPRTARSQGQAGVQVRKGPKPGTVGVIAHTPQAFDKAIALVKKQGAQIVYENRQGQAFTFRNPRSKPAAAPPAAPTAKAKRGAKAKAPRPAGTIAKPKGLKPGAIKGRERGAARKPRSKEARLASAYLRAERIAAQRKEQFDSAYKTAAGMRLDAQGIKTKKKREAALQSPELQAAAATSRRRDGQRQTAKKRAADLRDAYFQQLSKGSGQKGMVATKDRKRYDMLKESAYRLGQSLSRDRHDLAYNTNSMRYAEQVRVQARYEKNKRKMQRTQALIKRLANVSSVSEAPTLKHASAVGKRIKVPQLRPGRRSGSNLSSGTALMQSMPYIVMRNGRLAGSIYPQGRIDKIRAKRAGGSARLRKPAPKPPQPAKLPTGRTVYRTRAQAIRAQQARTNVLGKATAAKRGDNAAIGSQQAFVESAPRTVIGRPRIPQLSLSGRVERVGAGRFRTIGERMGGGSIRKPRAKPGPLLGSKAYKRELQRMIAGNGGKDVAAFRFR